jgi:hypothetical protein
MISLGYVALYTFHFLLAGSLFLLLFIYDLNSMASLLF